MVEFWCSESCQARWSGQFDEAALRRERVRQSLADNPSLREATAGLFAALDTASAVIQARTATRGISPLEAIIRAYEQIEAMPPVEPVKLTRAQLDAIRAECPPPPPFRIPGAIDHLMGRRIELVDTEEESTLFASANATFPQVASNPDPSRGWLDRWFARLFGRAR